MVHNATASTYVIHVQINKPVDYKNKFSTPMPIIVACVR